MYLIKGMGLRLFERSYCLRRRYTIALRSVVVAIGVAASALGWIKCCATAQREAVTAIRQAGGIVSYDWEPNHNSLRGKPTIWPRSLVDFLGVDYFHDVFRVRLDHRAHRSTIDDVAKLNNINELLLDTCSIDYNTLFKISCLRHLQLLSVRASFIESQEFNLLTAFPELEVLFFRDTPISDAFILRIRKHKHLKYIMLENTGVSEAAVEALRREMPRTLIQQRETMDPK
jgi:hypothetical protein